MQNRNLLHQFLCASLRDSIIILESMIKIVLYTTIIVKYYKRHIVEQPVYIIFAYVFVK